MQITCVAVVSCTRHMPCPFIIYASICSPLHLRQTLLKQRNAQTLTHTLCLALVLRTTKIIHPLLSHLFTSSRATARYKHKTSDIPVFQREICLCDKQTDVMWICAFGKQTGWTWASLLKGISKRSGLRQVFRVKATSSRTYKLCHLW